MPTVLCAFLRKIATAENIVPSIIWHAFDTHILIGTSGHTGRTRLRGTVCPGKSQVIRITVTYQENPTVRDR